MNATGETSSVRWGTTDIDYAIRRSNRRATVSISVDAAGHVVLTAPSTASRERLDRLVHVKAAWIVARLRGARASTRPAPREMLSGETFLYLGRQYRLRVDIDQSQLRPLVLHDGIMHVRLPRGLPAARRADYVRASLVDWYRRRATAQLPAHVSRWASRLKLPEPPLLIREQKKRWGSCTASGRVQLNWRIVQAPRALIEYVVAHELAHLRHPDHSAAFWAALATAMPDYERRQRALRMLGPSLTW